MCNERVVLGPSLTIVSAMKRYVSSVSPPSAILPFVPSSIALTHGNVVPRDADLARIPRLSPQQLAQRQRQVAGCIVDVVFVAELECYGQEVLRCDDTAYAAAVNVVSVRPPQLRQRTHKLAHASHGHDLAQVRQLPGR